jgi:hypothetical protein
LGGTGGDLKRRQQKNYGCVGELLQGVKGLPRQLRRRLQAQVGHDVVPGMRKNRPRVRNVTVVFAGGEQHNDVEDPQKDPADDT